MMFNGKCYSKSGSLHVSQTYLRSFSLLYSFSKYAMSASMHWRHVLGPWERASHKATRFLPQSVHLHGKMDSITQVNTQTDCRRMLGKALWKVKLEQGDS